MIKTFLLLAVGGIFGTGLRYLINIWALRLSFLEIFSQFPFGTLIVNSAGALIAGILWGVMGYKYAVHEYKTLCFVGFLGAFTTFSAYSIETMDLLFEGKIKLGLINILLNNVLSLFLVTIGFWLAKTLILKID